MTTTLRQLPILGSFLLFGLAPPGAGAVGPATPATSAAASAAATAAGENCDVLRDQIESRIAAAGVANFSVRIVDATATVDVGRVVGTCGRGSRKIVYETQTAPAPPPARSLMTTECRDGSVMPAGGTCKP
ncbi:MAG TPA: DUF1161 domain-containing protein [Variovorax sp.]|nr:DUF1161 domain-containing protein [Variovorax sp.]